MSNNRFFKNLSPEVPHRQSHEERDLRNDLYEALSGIADSLGVTAILEVDEPAAGENTATVRIQLLNGPGGDPVDAPVTLEFAVFDDPDGVVPATNANLNTATEGTILYGGGSPTLKIKTDATGLFECTLTDLTDESVYLSAFHSATGPWVNCVGSLEVAFIA
jgi:hypothetical protein